MCTCESFKVDQPNDNLCACVLCILLNIKKLKPKTLRVYNIGLVV